MWGPSLLAIFTLLVLNNELHLECLLKQCLSVDLLLDSQFDFDSARMGLSPNETCIDKFDSFKTLHILEAQS